MTAASTLQTPDGNHIAYHRVIPETDGEDSPKSCGVVFMGGFKSDMEGSKALFLHDYCQRRNIPFVRFDYFGHGQSSGDFTDGTIGRWKDDALKVLDELTDGPQIIVGSSLGGWIGLLATLARPDRVAGFMGIASAPDFTEDLIWHALDDSARETIQTTGQYALPNDYCNDPAADPEPYIITHQLITEARNHLLLQGDSPRIHITCPVRLLHGLLDADVPPETSTRLAAALASDDVRVVEQAQGDHRMSSDVSLMLIERTLRGLINQVTPNPAS